MTTINIRKQVLMKTLFRDLNEGEIFVISDAEDDNEYHTFMKIQSEGKYNTVYVPTGQLSTFLDDEEVIPTYTNIKVKIRYI